jgi:membrane-bound lytic murein transglycosylase B
MLAFSGAQSNREPEDGMRRLGVLLVSAVVMAGAAQAASCSSTGGKFESWKKEFAAEAKANGIKAKGLAALASSSYSTGTIKADRNQKSFKLSLEQFMVKRGAAAIISRGRKLKAANAALFAGIEKKYGVPAGPLIAIWGMETGFGAVTGNQPTVAAVATLAYDCRRTEFFTEQLYAALKLVDRGVLSSNTRGAMHGEVGQTQFLPKNILKYGTGGDLNNKTAALASTANFLSGISWKKGGPYSAGQFATWNAATVYQKALAIMATKIDAK